MNSKIIFLIAFIAVVTGLYGLYDAFTKKPHQEAPIIIEMVPEKTVRYITLWRAKEDLNRGSPITTSQLNREQIVFEDAIELGFKDDVKLDFESSTLLNSSIAKGDFVYPEQQTSKSQPGYLALLITEGMTLYPLQVTSKNIINDFISPGDYIDILAVSSPVANLATQSEILDQFHGVKASIFLKKVKVMNIDIGNGESDKNDNDEFFIARSKNASDSMITVVIEVSPSELARLSLAQRTMHIEIYRSHAYKKPLHAEVRDVIENYSGVEELRGSGNIEHAGGIL
ncbi:Flp pilus assembly protein CpaB [Photobacterium nomapromontoriensis]|uniref:Flp pilus assembly protein CpaB n=1 Tax=Photobacterium nomapromontoriensis TaxID=2910237 RepID=UPI003D0A47F9